MTGHRHELRGPVFHAGERIYLRETISLRGTDIETPTGEPSMIILKGTIVTVVEGFRHNPHWPAMYTLKYKGYTIDYIPEYLLRSA